MINQTFVSSSDLSPNFLEKQRTNRPVRSAHPFPCMFHAKLCISFHTDHLFVGTKLQLLLTYSYVKVGFPWAG